MSPPFRSASEYPFFLRSHGYPHEMARAAGIELASLGWKPRATTNIPRPHNFVSVWIQGLESNQRPTFVQSEVTSTGKVTLDQNTPV